LIFYTYGHVAKDPASTADLHKEIALMRGSNIKQENLLPAKKTLENPVTEHNISVVCGTQTFS